MVTHRQIGTSPTSRMRTLWNVTSSILRGGRDFNYLVVPFLGSCQRSPRRQGKKMGADSPEHRCTKPRMKSEVDWTLQMSKRRGQLGGERSREDRFREDGKMLGGKETTDIFGACPHQGAWGNRTIIKRTPARFSRWGGRDLHSIKRKPDGNIWGVNREEGEKGGPRTTAGATNIAIHHSGTGMGVQRGHLRES